MTLDIKAIDNKYMYNGDDLGCTVTNGKTTFKLWSPLSQEVALHIYEDHKSEEKQVVPMTCNEGVWEATVTEDVTGKFYMYAVTIDGETKEAVDPYAKSLAVNGTRSAIIDLDTTHPEGWLNHERPVLDEIMDMIIYEVHTKDFSIDANSGIENKGKFLGFSEENTTTEKGSKTGISHIKDMGISHVQLLPIYDYGSVDEESDLRPQYENKTGYNWGYDPEHYNSPEGSYATNPYEPTSRVKELKAAIQAFHKQGIGVIMDVVYNHMYHVEGSPFDIVMPGYYFRYNTDGSLANESGCGNAVASEHAMARKFIIDSVCYWVKEYKLDGLRFDLMGLIDVTTMNALKDELKKINPNIRILGEGWNMGETLSEDDKAIQKNAFKMKDIGFFNDGIRDALRGHTFEDDATGYLAGDTSLIPEVKKGIVGSTNYSEAITSWGEVEPYQSVNYIECHDNHTVYDKLKMQMNDEELIKTVCKFGASIVLLSQGIPFVHAGEEFLRTKQGDHNSYKSNDSINKLDWTRKEENMDTVEYFKGLIALRKSNSLFRLPSTEAVKNQLVFNDDQKDLIHYDLLDGEGNKQIKVIHNATGQAIDVENDKAYDVVVNKESAGTDVLATVESTINVQPHETLVLMNK